MIRDAASLSNEIVVQALQARGLSGGSTCPACTTCTACVVVLPAAGLSLLGSVRLAAALERTSRGARVRTVTDFAESLSLRPRSAQTVEALASHTATQSTQSLAGMFFPASAHLVGTF